MASGIVRLYLLCFAYHRFRQINDNLIEAFIHLLDQYEKDAKLSAQAAAQQAMLAASQNLNAAGKVLNLFVDASIPDDAPFCVVKERAFSLLAPDRFSLVANYMRNIAFDKTAFEWSCYGKLSPAFKRNLRHLFADLDFSGRVEDALLLEAVTFLQGLLRQGKAPRQVDPSAFPVSIIPTGLRRYLFSTEAKGKQKALDIDRYEFLIYRFLRNALEAGDVYVQDSADFRRFEDNLIDDARWQNKDAILREIGAPLLLAPIEETLAALSQEIEARFVWSIPPARSLLIARSTGNCPESTLKDCCGSLLQRQAFCANSLMYWTATSSMSPIRESFSPASSQWVPTWGCGRWRKYRGSATPPCKIPPAIT
jgi:hypothetical protein